MAYNKGERAEAYAALKLVLLGLKKEVKKCGNVYSMLKSGKIKIKTPQGVFVSTPAECQDILNDIKIGKTYFFAGKTNASIKSDCEVSDDGTTFIKSSIKSFVGSDPTLLNASQSTRVAYCLGNESFSPSVIRSINNTKDISKKFNTIFKTHTVEFGRFHSQTFENNLNIISAGLPQSVMNVLLKRYIVNKRYIKDLASKEEEEAIKALLMHAMIGMMPTTPYKKKDGEVGSLVIVKDKINWDIDVVDITSATFKDKLFQAAYIETPSTTRHEFAKIYRDPPKTGDSFIDLCLQIRLSSKLI